MEENRLKLLQQETNLDICMEFLARMIEKYSCEIFFDEAGEGSSK